MNTSTTCNFSKCYHDITLHEKNKGYCKVLDCICGKFRRGYREE